MMTIKKLSPWNWFRHEEDAERGVMPARQPLASLSWGASPLMPLHEEIERVFDQAFRNFGLPAPSLPRASKGAGGLALLKPSVDIDSTDAAYTITAEVPGVDEKDIKIEMMPNGTLSISGEKRETREDKTQGLYRVERSYGAFQRTLSLPDDADRDCVEASFKNGVLTVTVARRAVPTSAARQIEVNTGTDKASGKTAKKAA